MRKTFKTYECVHRWVELSADEDECLDCHLIQLNAFRVAPLAPTPKPKPTKHNPESSVSPEIQKVLDSLHA